VHPWVIAGNDPYYPDEKRWRWLVYAGAHAVFSAYAFNLIDILVNVGCIEWATALVPWILGS
jgi:hypothetical protein